MTDNDITTEEPLVVRELIRIGYTEEFDLLPQRLSGRDRLHDRRAEFSLSFNRPVRWIEALPISDLVVLMRSLAIAEELVTGWGFGSVSPVIVLLRQLYQRNFTAAEDFAEWVYHRTSNEWIRHEVEERSQREHFVQLRNMRWQEREARRQQHEALEQEQRSLSQLRRARHTAEAEHHRDRSAGRHEEQKKIRGQLSQKGNGLSPIERLRMIMSDTEFDVYLYPYEYAEINESALVTLSDGELLSLFERIKKHQNGPWGLLAK